MNRLAFRPGIETLEDRTLLSATGMSLRLSHHFGNPFHQVQQAVSQAVHQVTQVAHSLQQQAADADKQLGHQGTSLVQQLKLGASRDRQKIISFGNQLHRQAAGLIQSALNHKVVAYDFTTHGSLTANFQTGDYFGDLDFGFGATLSTDDLKALLEGQFPIPNVDLVQGATAAVGVHSVVTSSYDSVRDSWLNQTVPGATYFSSERFVNWATPDKLLEYTGALAATDGAALPFVLNDAKGQLLLELNNIYAWLRNVGASGGDLIGAAGGLLNGMLQAMLHHQSATAFINSFPITITPVSVPVTYTEEVGFSGLPGLSALGIPSGPPLFTGVKQQLGFVIRIPNATSPAHFDSEINSFDQTKLSQVSSIAQDFPAILQQALEHSSDSLVTKALRFLDFTSFANGFVDGFVRNKLFSLLHLNSSVLNQVYKPGSTILDLTHTSVADALRTQVLNQLGVGNEGGASVDQLQFNLDSDELSIKVTLHYRQSWGTAGDLLNAVDAYVKDKSKLVVQAGRALGRALGQQLKGLRHGLLQNTGSQTQQLGRTIRILGQRFLGELRIGVPPAQVAQEVHQEASTLINTTKAVVSSTVQNTKQTASNVYSQGKKEVQTCFGLC
jgi:hypothetical protein